MSAAFSSRPGLGLAGLRERLAQREDSEHVQAIIRIAFGLAISAYLYSTIGPHFDIHVVCIGFEVLSFGIFIAIIVDPRPSRMRRGFGAIVDLGTTTYLMWTNGEVGAPLYGIYLWVTFGNGFRYGAPSLYASQALSLVGFGSVVAFNPFWHQHSLMAGGFLILLAAVPFYGAVLLQGVKTAQDKAEQANEAKSRFLSAMSHEIRTPLNGIIGINALLRRTRVTPEQLDLINTLGMSSEVLLSLLDNVLDIAKIEAGKMTIEQAPFDLHAVINSAMKIAVTQAATKGLCTSAYIDAAVPRLLIGDQHRLRQVLSNLLSNATKFTHEGGVHLHTRLVGQNRGMATVRCEVIDTGVGMSPEAIAQIFQPFVQADQGTTRQFGGTGLGTTIAKQLIELMRGQMGARSALRQGSTFWFEAPFRIANDSGSEGPLDGVRVLLVGIDRRQEEHIIGLLKAWRVDVASCEPQMAARLILTADEGGTPWHVVISDQLGQNTPIVDLEVTLPSWKRRPRLIALNPPAPVEDRFIMLNWPYTAGLGGLATREHLHRALHFAALDELDRLRSAAQSERYRAIGKAAGRHRVLVAEDNLTNRKIIAQVLEYGGFDVTLATTGTQAVEALQQASFDVVILDKHMPGMSGMEVASRYLEMQGEHAPMIMLTAEATEEAMQQCKAAGMKAFLTKPIDPEMLFETIGTLIGVGNEEPYETRSSRLSDKAAVATPGESVLDESVLAELAMHAHSSTFVMDIVDSVESDLRDLIERFDTAVKDQDWPEIAEIRHAIEGTARSSGATAIVGLIGDLKSLEELDSAERDKRVAQLRICLDTTLDAMRRCLVQLTIERPAETRRALPLIS